MSDTLQYVLDEGVIANTALTERLRVFNQRCIVGGISAFAGIGLLAWVIWAAVGWTPARNWAMLISLVEVGIVLAGLRCRRVLDHSGHSPFWLNVQIGLAGIGGVTWGSAAWFIWQDGDTQSYLAALTILIGVAGVSMVTMSSYAKAAVLFFSGIYLTPLIHVLLHPNPLTDYLKIGLVVGFIVQLGYTRELGRVVLHDVEQYARNTALVQQLHDLVMHDQLTGAHSRRYTFDRLEQLVSTRQRHGIAASAIMFDLDHFKFINDAHGHAMGDRVLRETVKAVHAQLRDGDLLGRIGGEEFLVLLPMTDAVAALQLAERLRQTIAATTVEEGATHIQMTASFGIAELKPSENHFEWARRVDGALYQAKAQGRNTVIAAQ